MRVTVADVYRALWRHKFLIVTLTAVWVAATWYATTLQTRTYEASALVRIQQRVTSADDASASVQASEQLARTYAQIIGSGALDGRVRSLVAGQLPTRPAPAIDLSGRPVEDLPLLWISAQSDSARRARIVADATPAALRNFIRESGTLRDGIVTVTLATEPTSPVSPRLAQNLAIALVLGLIFNSALALLIEAFRDRLPEPDELGEVARSPVLATVPALRLRSISELVGRDGEVDRFNLPRPEGEPGPPEPKSLERLGRQ